MLQECVISSTQTGSALTSTDMYLALLPHHGSIDISHSVCVCVWHGAAGVDVLQVIHFRCSSFQTNGLLLVIAYSSPKMSVA